LADDYVELRARSAFSFLDGASNPEDLAERAAALGHTALALADRDGLYGIPRFHGAAAKSGLRALVGAELSDAAGLVALVPAENLTGPTASGARSEPQASEVQWHGAKAAS